MANGLHLQGKHLKLDLKIEFCNHRLLVAGKELTMKDNELDAGGKRNIFRIYFDIPH